MIGLEDAILVETKRLTRYHSAILLEGCLHRYVNGSVDILLIMQLGSQPLVRVCQIYRLIMLDSYYELKDLHIYETVMILFILLHQSISYYCTGETLNCVSDPREGLINQHHPCPLLSLTRGEKLALT